MRTRSAFTLFITALCTLAAANPAEARINERQDRQQVRIEKGVANGSLTRREASTLRKQQNHIARVEARSRADGGGLNRRERARIEVMQDQANASIYRKKHNGRAR